LSILALLFALPWQEKLQSEIGQERSIELKIGPYTSVMYTYEDDRDAWKNRRARQATDLPLLMEHVCWVRLDGLVIDLGPTWLSRVTFRGGWEVQLLTPGANQPDFERNSIET
jgi:hypothetical protein